MTFILLSSAKDDQSASRSFNEFKTAGELSKRLIDYFEEWLAVQDLQAGRTENSAQEYTSDQLFGFMDEFFGELCCLVRQEDQPDLWVPQAKDWIKEQIFLYLRGNSEGFVQPPQINNAMEVDV